MPSTDTEVTISLTSDAGDSQKLLRPKDGNYSNFQSSNRDSLISNASTTSRASTISEKWEFLLILFTFLLYLMKARFIYLAAGPWTSLRWTHRLFKKIKNAIFLEALKNPFKRLLQQVQNLTSFFLFRISQQIRSLEASKVSAEMGRGWQAD